MLRKKLAVKLFPQVFQEVKSMRSIYRNQRNWVFLPIPSKRWIKGSSDKQIPVK